MKDETEEWHGLDVDLETSLLEYGLLMRFVPEETGRQWKAVYGVDVDGSGNYNKFDQGWISEKDIADLMSGNDWMKERDIKSFLEYTGCSDVEEFLELSMVNKLHDLLHYWGHENIMGTAYYPWSKQHAMFITGLVKEDEKEKEE